MMAVMRRVLHVWQRNIFLINISSLVFAFLDDEIRSLSLSLALFARLMLLSSRSRVCLTLALCLRWAGGPDCTVAMHSVHALFIRNFLLSRRCRKVTRAHDVSENLEKSKIKNP